MGYDPGNLTRLDAIVEAAIEVAGHLSGMATGDDCLNGHNTAITGRKLRASPHIAEKDLIGIGSERRRYLVHNRRCDRLRRRFPFFRLRAADGMSTVGGLFQGSQSRKWAHTRLAGRTRMDL